MKNKIKSEVLHYLLLRVCDGYTQLAPLAWYINSMRRSEDACRWLIKNNLTGLNLYSLWVNEYQMSSLKVMSLIKSGLEKEKKHVPLFINRDIL